MKKTIQKISLALLLVVLGFTPGLCQGNETIVIKFLNAVFTDTSQNKALLAVFLVSTKDSASFPPQIKLPPKCTVFEDGREKVVLIRPENMGKVNLDDHKVEEKNPETYALIKDKLNVKDIKNSMIITYRFQNLNYSFTRMSLSPAFGEKQNNAIRVQQRFEFEVGGLNAK